jgi:protein subunit release factor B
MKDKILSVTEKDCKFDFYRGSGSGGQKKNKTSSACRCHHVQSKAYGSCEDHRQQRKNKETAFKRMCETKEFQAWVKTETLRKLRTLDRIEDEVEQEMKNVRVEVKQNGRWVEVDKETLELK